eukprot:m.208268 g.208268  ORF g.208268 m.208268 type:complete len:52 (+) comp15807_c3_seq13:3997-4152(+)
MRKDYFQPKVVLLVCGLEDLRIHKQVYNYGMFYPFIEFLNGGLIECACEPS